MLSGIAWIISDWRELTIFIVLSAVLYCVLTARTLKESPRWLLASGKPEEALENLTALAKGNDREIPLDGLPPLVRLQDTLRQLFAVELTNDDIILAEGGGVNGTSDDQIDIAVQGFAVRLFFLRSYPGRT